MRKTITVLGLALAITTVAGCDDDVTKVCKKMSEIASKDADLPEKFKKEAADIEGCKKDMGAKQKEDPEAFKKLAGCVDGAADMKGLFGCMEPAAAEKKE